MKLTTEHIKKARKKLAKRRKEFEEMSKKENNEKK